MNLTDFPVDLLNDQVCTRAAFHALLLAPLVAFAMAAMVRAWVRDPPF